MAEVHPLNCNLARNNACKPTHKANTLNYIKFGVTARNPRMLIFYEFCGRKLIGGVLKNTAWIITNDILAML